ncbi:metallophosphoesterase [Sunxiuqinia sp. sy24]|uniref:metallophosphoesterase n=1 Tax=Sunxiuqinia sp. sy24 TaxID=3461495 RepID=UPI0040464D53
MNFSFSYSLKVFSVIMVLFSSLSPVKPVFSQAIKSEDQKQSEKLFSFGLIADPQYADAEAAGSRHYRHSLKKMESCVSELNRYDLSFSVTLGDMIDHDYTSFDNILPILEKSKAPVYKVIGNHDFDVEEKYKTKVRSRLNNKKGYFAYQQGDFMFIVLDGTDLSTFGTIKGKKDHKLAIEKLNGLKESGENNAYNWNGGLGSRQFQWLATRLKKASRSNKKVVLFCHWPLLPENGTQLWDNKKVLELISKYENVVAWISGHHHAGGYHKIGGIHHLTMKGMVESELNNSYGIVEVYDNKLVLMGFGQQSGQLMDFTVSGQ